MSQNRTLEKDSKKRTIFLISAATGSKDRKAAFGIKLPLLGYPAMNLAMISALTPDSFHVTPDELEEGFLWARKYGAAPRTIFGRMFRAPRANWLTALGLNFSMRSGRMRQIKERWPRSKGRLTRPASW